MARNRLKVGLRLENNAARANGIDSDAEQQRLETPHGYLVRLNADICLLDYESAEDFSIVGRRKMKMTLREYDARKLRDFDWEHDWRNIGIIINASVDCCR